MTVQPLRRVFTVVNGGTPTPEPDNWDGDIAWATPVDLGRFDGARIGETQRTLTATGLRTGSSLIPAGSLIVSTRAPIGYIAETTIPMAFNQGCRGLVPRTQLDVRFFRYQLAVSAQQLQSRGQGSTFVELSTDGLASFPVEVPPLTEQSSIADYLDAETARTDALIAGLRKLLALVLERHASFRDRMVDADAGGSRRRLSSVLSARITDGPHETPEFVDEGVPFLSVDNMVDDGISFDGCRRISEAAHSGYARKSLPRRGDVLVTKAAAVGRVALVETDRVFNVWSPLAILRPDAAIVLPEYLHAALLGGAAQSRMKLASTSNTQENLSMRDLAGLRITVPSLRRQAEVVARVTHSAEVARVTSSALSRQIDLLLERRQGLIAAAVTGQLDIPGVAA